ncbi:hypothetical protein, partial [Thermogutta sp.]|uniref:hypothetical protein n=1 Tax=Thermogutta sp. TaxID=1962930 RepID=UPI0025DB4EB6
MLKPAKFSQCRLRDALTNGARQTSVLVTSQFTPLGATGGAEAKCLHRRQMAGYGLLFLILGVVLLAGCTAQKAKPEAAQETTRSADSSSHAD